MHGIAQERENCQGVAPRRTSRDDFCKGWRLGRNVLEPATALPSGPTDVARRQAEYAMSNAGSSVQCSHEEDQASIYAPPGTSPGRSGPFGAVRLMS